MDKINLYRTLGATLLKKGQWFLKNSHNVKYTQIFATELRNLFKQRTGIDKVYCADEKYLLTDWDTWQSLIKYDWTNKKKYVYDIFDCDNFADTFAARMGEIYNLNSVGKARGIRLTTLDGQDLGWHRANVIAALVNNAVKFFLYEAQTDEFIEITSKEPVLRGWKYTLNYFEF